MLYRMSVIALTRQFRQAVLYRTINLIPAVVGVYSLV